VPANPIACPQAPCNFDRGYGAAGPTNKVFDFLKNEGG
jgi:hypothetical protein